MGDKTEARRRMQQANVPVVPGAVTPVADLKSARLVAEEIASR
jgi:biotin carboxylase